MPVRVLERCDLRISSLGGVKAFKFLHGGYCYHWSAVRIVEHKNAHYEWLLALRGTIGFHGITASEFWVAVGSGVRLRKYPLNPGHSISKCWGLRQYSQVVRIEEQNKKEQNYMNAIYLIDYTQALKLRKNNSPLYKNL